jgi:hypothetical protein
VGGQSGGWPASPRRPVRLERSSGTRRGCDRACSAAYVASRLLRVLRDHAALYVR